MRYDVRARGGSLAGRLSPSVHLRGWWIEGRPLPVHYRNVLNSYGPDRNCPPWELCPLAAKDSGNYEAVALDTQRPCAQRSHQVSPAGPQLTRAARLTHPHERSGGVARDGAHPGAQAPHPHHTHGTRPHSSFHGGHVAPPVDHLSTLGTPVQGESLNAVRGAIFNFLFDAPVQRG